MLKRSITILFLLYFQIITFSQSITDNLNNALKQSRYNQPPDQVFLHFDRNQYHAGDTIRFQAYIRDRQTGIFSQESISLFSLLLNQSNQTVDSARFRIVNSTTPGWLKIPKTIHPGIYSVLAFTSMMMNYDPEFTFSVPIRIDGLKTDKLETDQIVEKTGYPSCQTASIQPVIDLRFLPEGGTFIADIPQRMAFNAVTSSGRTLKVNGEISNQRGEKIAEFLSWEFGPGLVEFTPLQGDTYFASLKGEEFSGMKWPLPIPDSSGISLRVNNNNEGVIDILLEGRGVEGKAYILALTMNNSLVLSRDVSLDSLFRLGVNTEELPAGTAYITLYDSELNPVAERQIFVNDNKKMNIEISSSFSVINSGDETELILNTTDNKGENISSIISIAVIDSASGFCNTIPFPDIETTFIYDRIFYNNLPPEIKLHGLDNIDKKSIDLLLMTYGWRKFRLKEYPDMSQDKKLLDYDYLKISDLEPDRKGKLNIQILTSEDANVLTLPVDNDKEAIIPFSIFNDSVRRIRILAYIKSMKNLNSVKVEFPENRIYTDRAKQQNNYLRYNNISTSLPPYGNPLGKSIRIPNIKEVYFFPDSVITIEEVTIRPRRSPPIPPVYINKYEELYRSGSIRTMTTKEIGKWPSFEDILALFNPYYIDSGLQQVYLRQNRSFQSTPALFVLDDREIGNSYETIDWLTGSQIESITVLKGSQAFWRYGAAASGGVVFITTKTGLENDHSEKDNDLIKTIRLFRSEIEYYVPTKEQTDSIPGLQCRPTILWMSEVIFDGKEPVKIRFPDNMSKGTVIVIVNGVSFTNKIGSNSYKYKIQ